MGQKPGNTLLVVTLKRAENLAAVLPNPLVVHDTFHKSVSRLRYKPDVLRFKLEGTTIDEVLAAKTETLSWDECCYRRAKQLLALSAPGPLYVSWSGGIDSTCMLASLLKVATREERRRIVAVYSHHSVLENPTFFASHVAGLKRRNVMRDISRKLLTDGGLFVTGEMGDQLFGSDLLTPACAQYGEGILHEPFRDSAAKVIEANTKTPGSGAAIFERFEPIAEECPFRLRTAFDFFWWLNYTQKWQFVKFRFFEAEAWDLGADYGKHVLHFYDTPEFETWSLNNHHLKIRGTWGSYKWAARDFLARITGDERQLTLRKILSAEKTYLVNVNRLAVTSARKPVTTAEELASYAAGH